MPYVFVLDTACVYIHAYCKAHRLSLSLSLKSNLFAYVLQRHIHVSVYRHGGDTNWPEAVREKSVTPVYTDRQMYAGPTMEQKAHRRTHTYTHTFIPRYNILLYAMQTDRCTPAPLWRSNIHLHTHTHTHKFILKSNILMYVIQRDKCTPAPLTIIQEQAHQSTHTHTHTHIFSQI